MTKDMRDHSTVIINDHQAVLGRKYNEIFQKYHERYNQREVPRPRRQRSRRKGPATTTTATSSPCNDDSSGKSRARCQSEPVVLPPIPQHGRPVAAVTNNYFENTPIRLRIFNNLKNNEAKPSKSPRSLSPGKGYQHKNTVPLSHDSLLWNSSQIYERLRKGKRTSPTVYESGELRSDDPKALLRRTNGNRSFRYRREIGLKPKNDEDTTKDTSMIPTQVFNIREKIEQFKEWHEKEYKNKLEHLKQNTGNTSRDVEHLPAIETDHKIKQNMNDRDASSIGTNHPNQVHTGYVKSKSNNDSTELLPSDKCASTLDCSSKSPATQRLEKRVEKLRESSAKSWKTWRDVNDSYAYDNVEAYIRDNDLLSTDKRTWIETWVEEALKIRDRGIEDEVDSDSTMTDEDENLFP